MFLAELKQTLPTAVELYNIDGHINDPIFAETALKVFDDWCEKGLVRT